MFSWSFFCMQFSWADFWSPFQVRDMPLPSKFWVTCLTLLYLLCMHARTHSFFSHVWVFATPWTVVCQASLPMGFSRQEYWSRLPFASPGNLPNSGIKPRFPAFQADTKPPGKSLIYVAINTIFLGPKSDSQWFLWILSVPCTCLFWNVSLELELVVSYMDFISSINVAITFFSLWGSDAIGQAYEPARLKLGGYGMWKIQTSSQIRDHEPWTAPRPYLLPMENVQ